MKKRLTLTRETLTELAHTDLVGIVGGLSGPTCVGGVFNCVSDKIVGCANLTTGCTR